MMNPIFSAANIQRSDQTGESAEEQFRRKEFQRRLVASKGSSGSTRSAEDQLEAFLRSSRGQDSAPARPEGRVSRQATTAPFSATSSKEASFEREVLSPFDAHTADNAMISASKGSNSKIKNDTTLRPMSKIAVPAEDDHLRSQSQDAPVRTLNSSLENLRDALDRDISSFSAEDLVEFLANLQSSISSYHLNKHKSVHSKSDSPLNENLCKEAMIALEFMQGYSDAQSRQPHERHQIDQAFAAIRDQLVGIFPAADMPLATVVQMQAVQPLVSNNSANSSDKKSTKPVASKKEKEIVRDVQEESVERSIDSAVQFAKQEAYANWDASSRSRSRRKEKEKEELTLPLIVQRSA